MDVTTDNQHFDQNGMMTPELEQLLRQHYDVVGIDQLESVLRQKITEFQSESFVIDGRKRKGSYKLLSESTGVSTTYLWQFHKEERAICITNMNILANHFGVTYMVSNFIRNS